MLARRFRSGSGSQSSSLRGHGSMKQRLSVLIVATLFASLCAAPAAAAATTASAPVIRASFSTFGTISTSGAVTDRFGVGNDFDAVTFVSRDLGYGPNLFYYLRHDANGFTTFGTISTSGAITDRFGVG